jgi:CDP-paratose 2-epimerase
MLKRILITGGAGFIGSTLAQYFLNLGYRVLVFDSLIRQGVEYNIKRLKGIKIIKGDVRYEHDLKKIGKVNVIIHAAANPGIRWSILKPKYDFDTNALGTFNILEFARKLGGYTGNILFYK